MCIHISECFCFLMSSFLRSRLKGFYLFEMLQPCEERLCYLKEMIRLIVETFYNWVVTLPMMGKKVPVFGIETEIEKSACAGKQNHTVLMQRCL